MKEISNKELWILNAFRPLFGHQYRALTDDEQKRLDRVTEVMTTLNLKEMELFSQRFIDKKSYRQIAKNLGFQSHRSVIYHLRIILIKFQ